MNDLQVPVGITNGWPSSALHSSTASSCWYQHGSRTWRLIRALTTCVDAQYYSFMMAACLQQVAVSDFFIDIQDNI
jgi:hypothetical protein